MPNFVYDATGSFGSLTSYFPKSDATPIGAGDPTTHCQAVEWNAFVDAFNVIRLAITSGSFIGFIRSGSTGYVTGSATGDYLFLDSNGNLVQHLSNGTQRFVSGNVNVTVTGGVGTLSQSYAAGAGGPQVIQVDPTRMGVTILDINTGMTSSGLFAVSSSMGYPLHVGRFGIGIGSNVSGSSGSLGPQLLVRRSGTQSSTYPVGVISSQQNQGTWLVYENTFANSGRRAVGVGLDWVGSGRFKIIPLLDDLITQSGSLDILRFNYSTLPGGGATNSGEIEFDYPSQFRSPLRVDNVNSLITGSYLYFLNGNGSQFLNFGQDAVRFGSGVGFIASSGTGSIDWSLSSGSFKSPTGQNIIGGNTQVSGNLEVSGSIGNPVVQTKYAGGGNVNITFINSASFPYIVLNGDYIVHVLSMTASAEMLLPLSASKGTVYIAKDAALTASVNNTLTIRGSGAVGARSKVDGTPSGSIINTRGGSLGVYSDGNDYWSI